VPFWPAAGPGQLLLVPDDGGGWCAVEADAAGVHLQPLSTAAGMAAASVELAGVAPIATAEGVDGEALRRTGILLAASELVGLADRLVEEARSYAGERHQFGRPVGSFQGLAWMIVEAHVAVDGAGLLVDEALVADERRAEGGAMLAAAAFGTAADAAQRAARTSHQVFGAIGYTTDLPIELLSRRVTVTSRLFGGKRQQWRAVGADVLRLHDRPAQGAPT
jgi:alkylation response protein AidB-like acyl-CoA dehydrogenase